MAAVAVVATTAVLASAASPAVADQTPIEVQQGREVSLGVIDFGAPFWTDPASAGTLEFVENGPGSTTGELFFTASTQFAGPVSVRGVEPSGQPFLIAIIEVVGDYADVYSTFTPRPAPGPCLVIQSGGNVDFGDVTVGSAATAPTDTVVRNCSTLQLSVAGVVSQAVFASGSDVIAWNPTVDGQPGPNEFRYAVTPDGGASVTELDGVLHRIVTIAPTGIFPLQHELAIGPGSTTGLNSLFRARVLLLATTA